MSHSYKLSVVGYESSILIYRAIGADTFAVVDETEAREAVEKLVAANLGDEAKTPIYAVVFVEETFYQTLPPELLEKFSKRALPALVPVPSPSSGKGKSFSKQRLARIVEKAVGSDIFN